MALSLVPIQELLCFFGSVALHLGAVWQRDAYHETPLHQIQERPQEESNLP